MIDSEKLKVYFNTPRQVSDAFDITTANHKGYTSGYRLKAVGILVIMGLGIASYFNYTPWYTIAIGAIIWIIGEILCKKHKAEAIDLGRKELANLPASFAGIIQCNPSVFENQGSGFSVIVYSTDPNTASNSQVIINITSNLRRMADQALTPDEVYIANKLNDTRTYFSKELLNPSVTGGLASVFWTVKMLNNKDLPAHFDTENDVLLLFMDNANSPKYLLPGVLY